MTASSARRLTWPLAGLLALAWASPGAAQTGPLPLRPPTPAPVPAPAPQPQAAPAVPPAAPADVRPERRDGVVVDELRAVDPNAVGVLDEAQGGYGVEMWSGTRQTLVQNVLPALPATTVSPTARAMMLRLLLSRAAVPEGEPAPGPSLIQLRVDRLRAMGEVEAMLGLLQAVPKPEMTAALLRHRIDGLLLRGDHRAACAELPQTASAGTDAYVSMLRIFCQFLAGRLAEASLGVELLRELGQAEPAFVNAFELLVGLPVPELQSLPEPSPLLLAMYRMAQRGLPADAAGSGDPAVLWALARDGNLPTEARLRAAEKAESIGALGIEFLGGLYQAVTFTPEELRAAGDQPPAAAGPRSRAQLFQAALAERAPAPRAELITKALGEARRNGHFASAARLYAPLIRDLPPSLELAGMAELAARALLSAGGRIDEVAPWFSLARQNPGATDADWPLLRLMDPREDEPLESAALAEWLRTRSVLAPDQADRQAALLFGLLDALGNGIGSDAWARLLAGPPLVTVAMPRPALWHGLRIAAEDLRLAETVALALASLGDGFPAGVEPTSLYRIVASLRLVGFDAEARELALEAAIANGL